MQDTGSSGLAACKAAQQLGLITSYAHAFGVDHLAAALQFGPAMLGINWYEGMFYPDANAVVHPTGQIAGGHEFLCVGVNMAHRYFTCLNSWGPTWGNAGKFRITWDDMNTLLNQQGDVIQPQH